MSFNTANREAGNSPFDQHSETRKNWKKQRADGKWFWLFKRAAVWLTFVILLFGAGNFLFPEQVNFQGTQIFIAVFMFAGYLIGSLNEWSKMEKTLQTQSLPPE